MNQMLRIDADGYFSRGGKRVVPVGVNYWPASSGVEMWARWDAGEIQADLDTVADLGLNCIRFFLRWQDFEPEEGRYDEAAFNRLETLLSWLAQRDLLAQPSLFVGGMSGGVFWPAWKSGRNLYSDPALQERSRAFAGRVARSLAASSGRIAGIDYGNEMEGLSDSRESSPEAVRAWCQGINEAVRAQIPSAMFVAGISPAPLTGETPWRYENDLGTSFLSVHPYPVPHWQGLRFDGLRDPFAQAYMPYTVSAARAFGPVMVQEFGTLITGAAQPQDAYLRAVLPAAWKAGANGFLWWCLRDVRARSYNYVRSAMESFLGLVDDRRRVKPGLEYFLEFAREVNSYAVPAPPDVALYWPKHYHQAGDPGHTHNDPRTLHNRMLSAYHLLGRLGVHTGVVRGGETLPPYVKVVLIAGAHLDADESAALARWVNAGGKLIWHGPRWSEWGHDTAELLGARPADFRLQQPATIDVFGRSWKLAHYFYPENARLEVVGSAATALASDNHGLPLVWQHDMGQGRVIFTVPIIEDAVLASLMDLPTRDSWSAWLAGELELLGYRLPRQ